MWIAGRSKARATAIALLLATALAVAGAVPASADMRAERMVLRLVDLPPAYAIGDDSGCGALGSEGAAPALAEFIREHRPVGCTFDYERLFRVPSKTRFDLDPPQVSSFAILTRSPAAAEAGFAIVPELTGMITGQGGLRPVGNFKVTTPELWPQLRHEVDRTAYLGRSARTGAAVVWRSGPVLAGVYVGTRARTSAMRDAIMLAGLQHLHVLRPTPYTKAAQDWTEVPLENPAIRFPVYWLGRTFRPGKGLPPSPLRDASLPVGPGEGPPGMRARLSYDRITLATFTRSSWRQWEASPLGDLVRSWDCTQTTRLELSGGGSVGLPEGNAIVYAGYAKDFGVCPSRPPDVFLAEVHLGRVVVGIDLPSCERCIEAGRGPYYSKRDMGVIARALRLRAG